MSKDESDKVKEEIQVTRAEAVQRILTVLEQLQRGTVVLGDKTFRIPEQLVLELEADGQELEIELKWKPSATESEVAPSP